MKNMRVLFELVPPSKLIDIQKKINQWMTVGLLVKYKSSVVGDNVLFEIILKKEA